ncbi:hypothetical protein BDV32DRAFT_118870 [Aspergillus pseudonomiae]|uniref:Uncharacterized protein n=1 Tax=Aspergillus pseudonomiae TaxID=1506151 RepID=A0A5N6IBY2_9EURO|nr:uncharacterized protein BDV37DRAFT_238636 [Aspergillus pseudonomiae]KAB8263567.1 hypothetical protein BDV32DRAFT_118870 [Aspergillus pseudonomiae]KAE8408434.1 hypothetical protein BDV37DRAFT_238636 [Aspergillus pseudonomiae]
MVSEHSVSATHFVASSPVVFQLYHSIGYIFDSCEIMPRPGFQYSSFLGTNSYMKETCWIHTVSLLTALILCKKY